MYGFRPAVPADLETVCGLYRAASQNPFSVWDEEYPTIREALHDQQTGNLYVFTDGSTVIGAVSIVPENEMDHFDCWQFIDGNHREIARITLSPGYQGKGLSSLLVGHILEVLRQRGYDSVRLSAAACNLPARKTYEKLGFQVRGEADLYGSHYYLLEKAL